MLWIGRSGIRVAAAFVSLLTLCMDPAFGQDDVVEFSRFRVFLHDGRRVEGLEGSLTPSVLKGRLEGGAAVEFPRTDVSRLEVGGGNYALEGAGIGAGVGLLTSLSVIAQVALDDQVDLEQDAAVAITAGVTVGSALVGAAIGAVFKKWKTLPLGRTAWYPAERGVLLCAIRF